MSVFSSIKAKAASKFPSDAKKRLKDISDEAVSVLQLTLHMVKDVGGAAGCPGLQAGIGGLLVFIDAIKVSTPNPCCLPRCSLTNQVEDISKCR